MQWDGHDDSDAFLSERNGVEMQRDDYMEKQRDDFNEDASGFLSESDEVDHESQRDGDYENINRAGECVIVGNHACVRRSLNGITYV
jgi:hypothetical protein